MNNIRELRKPSIDGNAGYEFGDNKEKPQKTYGQDDKDQTPSLEEGAVSMDNDKILEKYIEMHHLEKRDMEKRIMDDRRESEARIDTKFGSIERKIDLLIQGISSFEKSVESKVQENNKFIANISIAVILGIAAMVIAVVLSIIFS